MQRTFSIGANVGITLLCLAGAYRLLMFQPASRRTAVVALPSVGSTAVALPDIDYSRHRQTLVLGLRSSCRYCTLSMPFYRHLAGIAAANGTLLVAVSGEPLDVFREYLSANGLQGIAARQIALKELDIGVTPTAVLISQTGQVAAAWRGQLNALDERALVDAVRDP